MNWKSEAANDLTTYSRKKESLENMREQMATLKYQYTSVKGMPTDTTPVMGGGSRIEDRMLDNIVKRQRTKIAYVTTQKIVTLIERGLAGLSVNERLILERFYIYRTKDCIERLCNELGYEQAQIYRLRNEALYKFTISMYGIIES